MKRFLAILTVGLVAGAAVADIGPPPGQKRVTLDHKITTEKDIADYTFFTHIGLDTITAVKFDSKTPVVVKGAGRGGIGRVGYFVAVPKDAAKNFASEKEFHKAIVAGKVDGMARTKGNLDPFTVVKETDVRELIVLECTLEKIDGKEILLKDKKGGAKKDGKMDSPDEDDTPSLQSGAWVAGLAGFAGLTLGGLWLVGRGRRRAGPVA